MFAKKFYVLGFALAVSMCMGLSGAIASDCNFFGCPDDCKFTTDFRLQDCWSFQTVGINPYFKLIPGYKLVLESDEERAEVTVLMETKWIDLTAEGLGWIRTRVVEERESELTEEDEWVVTEVSRNYFAICKKTNAVYYFGEEVWELDEEIGDLVPGGGAWEAGLDGAMPGLIMPGTFLLGSRYFQEIAEEAEAVDRGENVAMGLTVETPAGIFENCVKVVDTNPAEGICKRKNGDVKKYCPGIGLVKDEDLKLVCYGFHCDE